MFYITISYVYFFCLIWFYFLKTGFKTSLGSLCLLKFFVLWQTFGYSISGSKGRVTRDMLVKDLYSDLWSCVARFIAAIFIKKFLKEVLICRKNTCTMKAVGRIVRISSRLDSFSEFFSQIETPYKSFPFM